MTRLECHQFNVHNMEFYKEDPLSKKVRNNQEKINYSIHKSKLTEFDIKTRGEDNIKLYSNDTDSIKKSDNIIGDNNTVVPFHDNSSIVTSSISVSSDTLDYSSSSITVTSDTLTRIKKGKRNSRSFFSFYDIIDPSMCFQSCYNHALLVNNVYPKAGEEGAKTNNLSYLMFYAKSRPQKLIKVGNYLEKKAKRDIWNSRQE